MGEYLKTVVSAVFAVGIITALLPKDGFSKYVNLLAGIIVMAVIISPILSVRNKSIEFEKIDTKSLDFNTNSYIMEEYEKELAKNIENMLTQKTKVGFSVLVFVDKDEDIIEIQKIEITPYTKEYALLVSDYIGIDEGRITQT